jgi:hypothetical protein
MSGFLSRMMAELGARRRRLRGSLGEYGQALAEFVVLGCLLAGSLGLFLLPWMPAAAPWGFAMPFVLVGGLLWLEKRRQDAVTRGAEPEAIAPAHDWAAFLLAFGCAVAGLAAFLIAYGAAPEPPPRAPDWHPPADAVASDIAIPPPP